MAKLESRIFDNIEIECKIFCTKCTKISTLHGIDNFEAIEIFIEDGWYATEKNTYCSECNKKRNK